MNVFVVMVSWKKREGAAPGIGYPTYSSVVAATEDSPQYLQNWKQLVASIITVVTADPAYFHYDRLADETSGDVLTLTYYSSKEAYDALTTAHQSLFEQLPASRQALAEGRQLDVVEKHVTCPFENVYEKTYAEAKAFFDSVD